MADFLTYRHFYFGKYCFIFVLMEKDKLLQLTESPVRSAKRLVHQENNSPHHVHNGRERNWQPASDCPTPIYMAVRGKNENNAGNRILKLPCNQWKCPVCGPKKAFKLRKRLKKATFSSSKYFITLTLKINNDSLKENTVLINKAWDIALKRIRRIHPFIKYFKVLEYTKKGMPHLHIITDVRLTKKYLKTIWYDITKTSFIVDIGKLRQKSYNYVLKYALKIHDAKNSSDFVIPKGHRFYSHTRGLLEVIHKESKYTLIAVSKYIMKLLLELHERGLNDENLLLYYYDENGDEKTFSIGEYTVHQQYA